MNNTNETDTVLGGMETNEMVSPDHHDKQSPTEKNKTQDTESQKTNHQQETGNQQEETGDQQEETGDQQEETGDQQEETGVQQEETGDQQEETGDQQEETGDQQEETGDQQEELDEYMYTKRDEFTSEIFKIQVSNLPKRFGFAELKKKLIQLELKPVKMKVWKDICFITFRCETDREDALQKINGLKWRGCDLTAQSARPAADPLMRKRKQEGGEGGGEKKGRHEDDGLTPSEKLKNSVTPLWKLEYPEQLRKKSEEMRGFLKRLHRQLEKNCPDIKHWLLERKKKYGAIPCELLDILPSPVTEGYRNKCEFTVGPGLDGDSVVGFRYGTYAQGTVCVGSPEEVSFLPDAMQSVVKAFQQYISGSNHRAFNPEDHTGHWRQLAVRTSRLGHLMIMIDFHPQNLTQEAIDSEIQRIREYFTEGQGRQCHVTSCYFRPHTDMMTGGASEAPYQLVFGEQNITESLLGMKFQISPSAFFQVNTAAAEVLYRTVSDWCNVSSETTVLDVCCGTGTIGLTVAKKVNKVIGVEMCPEAVADAKVNAEINDITNVCYHCAKAEDVMKDITRSVMGSTNVVAIVDPPRGGLHSSVVVAIRNCCSINKLIYVSCNVNGALNNMIDLVRPTSKRLKGERFYPVKAVPLDLFPYTNHCELVMLFERENPDDPKND